MTRRTTTTGRRGGGSSTRTPSPSARRSAATTTTTCTGSTSAATGASAAATCSPPARTTSGVDAPLEAESSIALRGYKSGQYLGRNVATVEIEERFHLARAAAGRSSPGSTASMAGGRVARTPRTLTAGGRRAPIRPRAEGRHRGKPGIRPRQGRQLRGLPEGRRLVLILRARLLAAASERSASPHGVIGLFHLRQYPYGYAMGMDRVPALPATGQLKVAKGRGDDRSCWAGSSHPGAPRENDKNSSRSLPTMSSLHFQDGLWRICCIIKVGRQDFGLRKVWQLHRIVLRAGPRVLRRRWI